MNAALSPPPFDHDITTVSATRRGPRRTVAAWLLAAAGGLGSTVAPAQAPCTSLENDAERLACYDRALRASSQAAGPSATPAAPAAAAAAAAPAAAAPAAAAAAAAPAAATAAAVVPPTAEIPAAVTVTSAPATSAPGTTTAPAAESVPIVVVAVRVLQGRPTLFTTDTGVKWTQTDAGSNGNLPDVPFNAEIKRGVMNSYFLVPGNRSRAIRVRRDP